ncbi:hypothetical protein [Parasitella parasitica]|uniref:Uncharacterized protein n=1 Tax=Parasitella parasitica TaxID=35722 RepID=A0A0B7NTG2_9FUNG|nr:hypothetical protein [Parasitella parasitica]
MKRPFDYKEVPLYAADEADDEPSNDESVQVDDTVEDENQEASRIRLIDTKYKTSGVVEKGSDDLACVYDCKLFKNVSPNSYTKSELISIELHDLVKEFSIRRDTYGKLVRLINTTISHNDKLARGNGSNPQIMHRPQIERMMQQQATLSAHFMIYVRKAYCSYDRFDSRNSNKPFQTIKIISNGDIISSLIANPLSREELRYRHNLDADHHNDEHPDDEMDRVIIRDVFDAEDYQRIRNTHFTNESASFSSYLSVILAEIERLSTHGVLVNTPDNLSICLRVHFLVAGGDIPAVFDWNRCAYHSLKDASKGVHPENRPQGLYSCDTDAAMRTREDYRDANYSLGFDGVIDVSTSNTKFYHKCKDGAFEVGEYPFYIPDLVLKKIGKQIEKTRSFIPIAFDGAFQDIVQKTRGTKAVNYLVITMYIVPTFFIPEMTSTQVSKAIMRLTRGTSLSLQWEST